MSREDERLKILELIDSGAISVEQGLELINSLGDAEAGPEELPGVKSTLAAAPAAQPEPQPAPSVETPSTDEQQPASPPEPEDLPSGVEPKISATSRKVEKWKNWWWIPLWVGVGITLISAFLMFLAWQQANTLTFWFACTWFPFMFGVAVMALAWASRTARWIHVRVSQKPGEKPGKIAISLPFPLHLTAWFLRTFRHRIPGLENTAVDEVILALRAASPETPFYVEVNDGDDGEHVEVYIG